jgi:plasmid stabilization system protein ParE
MDKIAKLTWTDTGINSFTDIIEHIALDSIFYASNFGGKILKLIEKLEYFPDIGRIVPEYNILSLRELIYQNYRIIYKINNHSIYIIYIGHNAKLLPPLIEVI